MVDSWRCQGLLLSKRRQRLKTVLWKSCISCQVSSWLLRAVQERQAPFCYGAWRAAPLSLLPWSNSRGAVFSPSGEGVLGL